MAKDFDAILMIGYGAPEKLEDIMPFLRNVAKYSNSREMNRGDNCITFIAPKPFLAVYYRSVSVACRRLPAYPGGAHSGCSQWL